MSDEVYEATQTDLLARDVDLVLDDKLTGKPAVEALAAALRSAAFELEEDDLITITTAAELKIADEDEYARGYELLNELGNLETRIDDHYARFDRPLNFLVRVVRSLRGPQKQQVTPIKQELSKRLGKWKADRQEADRQRKQREQEVADAAAKAAQLAKAASLERVAAVEPNPQLAQSFRNEAENVRAAEVRAAPVPDRSSVPVIPGGYTTTRWKCEFVNVKELMKAYVEGRVFLNDDDIIAGLQSAMDKQAQSLTVNLGKAFPGTRAVPNHGAVMRRR